MMPQVVLSSTHHTYSEFHNHISSDPRVSPVDRNVPQSLHCNNVLAGRKRKDSETDCTDLPDGTVRRRISRACDQCNQLRTRCSGQQPCSHCADNGLLCEYARVHKKRGRAPKKENSQSDDHLPLAHTSSYGPGHGPGPGSGPARPAAQQHYSLPEQDTPLNGARPVSRTSATMQFGATRSSAFYPNYGQSSTITMASHGHLRNIDPNLAPQLVQPSPINYPVPIPLEPLGSSSTAEGFEFPLGHDYSVAFMGKPPMVESAGWLGLGIAPSIPSSDVSSHQTQPQDALRYPVLRPLLPHIEPIMPQSLACDLLEQYFGSSSSAYLHPSNPYILAYVFRKKSILHLTNPRQCTPALLASMLWITAQTSNAAFLTAQVDARARICQKLLELTINLLKPAVPTTQNAVDPRSSHHHMLPPDAGLVGVVAPTDTSGQEADQVELDNIVTYIHLATVVSASERKAASLGWWNAAWTLARQIRLGRELAPNPTESDGGDGHPKANGSTEERTPSLNGGSMSHTRMYSEEEREERRRAWWLLYMQDRHLAICYNRPMFFLNRECESLLQPMDDELWQAGRFEGANASYRRKGLTIECTSNSIFGFFLPLMIILGEILDLNNARNRPRFGPAATTRVLNWDGHVDEIVQQLETYGRSLREFEASNSMLTTTTTTSTTDSHDEVPTPSSRSTHETCSVPDMTLQTKTTVAYGTHIMHVLHILLTGKWDPIALLDDNDLWISSQSFVTATGHAVSAAEAVADIIKYDPDFSLMPYFFGIYLLQGSFLLLLFADKLQGDVSPDVVKACETIVRAHEACVATLDTQYQRNFRKVMRSALQQVGGGRFTERSDQQQWRREVLALYRWTSDGTGLAL